MSYTFASTLGQHAYDEDWMREFYRDEVSDYETGYPAYDEDGCLHRLVASTGNCYICSPERAEDDEFDYYDELPEYSLVFEDELKLDNPSPSQNSVMSAFYADSGNMSQIGRSRRRQWYQQGQGRRRRQDHGTANMSRPRNSQVDYPNRTGAKRRAIKDSLCLNKITAEFERNYVPVGDEFDEDYATALERQRVRELRRQIMLEVRLNRKVNIWR